MKPRIFLLLAIVCGLTFIVNSRSIETQRIGETLRADIKSQLEHRYDKRKVLKAKQFFANNKEITFNDGYKPWCLDGEKYDAKTAHCEIKTTKK